MGKMMKWKARLRFKACGYRLVRQELDSAGNAVGDPCDIYIDYWTVPDADGDVRRFIAVDKIEYRHEPLKMNVVDHGYKTIADNVWRTSVSGN